MAFTVVIVGRPNVGKSTLFNRLTSKRQALVDDSPGVTRDARNGIAQLGALSFTLVDTAGLEDAADGTLQFRMSQQSKKAMKSADVVLFMVDGRAGILPADVDIAKEARKSNKNVVLLVNKAEGNKVQSELAEAYRLGLGEPLAISAEHGEGMVELHDTLMEYTKTEEEPELPADESEEREDVIQLAIVGRPNVGKSTLFNHILGEERTLTGPEAGITRDAILVECTLNGRKVKLVDTAGMRRKAGVVEKLEKLAVADTLEALRYAHVVIWMVDANQPLEKQDNTIAALIEREGRAVVLAVNKWDEVTDEAAWMKALNQRLAKVMAQLRDIPVVPVSARTGKGVSQLIDTCFKMYELWNTKIPTGELNRWLEAMLESHAPPLIDGRRLKIRYMTQKTARPPTFLLFSNASDIPDSYMRNLSNGLRERFD
ncbi:MAG: ribosome biogenesis GTPase Der [Alphaproteobacteria bacterium]